MAPTPSAGAGLVATTALTAASPTTRTLEAFGAPQGRSPVARSTACPRTGTAPTVAHTLGRTGRVLRSTPQGRTTPAYAAVAASARRAQGTPRPLRTFATSSTTRTVARSPPNACRTVAPNGRDAAEGRGRRTTVASPTTVAHAARRSALAFVTATVVTRRLLATISTATQATPTLRSRSPRSPPRPLASPVA